MNVRLKKEFAFSTGLVFDGNYAINQYMMTVSMVTNTNDHREQNVAYERVKYWIHNVLDHSVLIQQDSELLPAFLATGQRVITVSEAPVDQIIGIMLYSKLNAIDEERLIVVDV
jgi:transcriptional regulator CtsR